MNYRIREVDTDNEDIVDTLKELHALTFFDEAEQADYTASGHWWLAYYGDEPVAFAGITPSQYAFNCGYLKRVGVLPAHRGHGLQKRLIRVREARARKNGWALVVTDTTENVASANSLIAAGYKMFTPKHGWAFDRTLYWRKQIIERN